MEDIIGFVIENENELLNTVVPDSFFIEGKNVDLVKFLDYAHFTKHYPTEAEEVDEADYILLIFIGKKIGNCYDSNATNKEAWIDYFKENEIVKISKYGY